jgi:hypothetical protein
MFKWLTRRPKSNGSETTYWPFSSPRNEAVFTVAQIINGEREILYVRHDADDGGWQFLTGENLNMSDAKLVALGEIALRDPTVFTLADLPEGWRASRATVNDPWARSIDPAQ